MDEGRFLSLFLRHERSLAAMARALLPDWNAVDDVLQESSLVMWRKIDALQSDDEFLPWAKVIVRFESLKHRRSHARRRWVLSEDVMELIADESVPLDEPADRREAVQRCLDRLGRDDRDLVLAPYRHHGGVKELAGEMGVSPNSLYKKLGRLRNQLHRCVTDQCTPECD